MSESTKKAAEWWSDPQSEAPETQWVRVPGVGGEYEPTRTGDPSIDWINHSAGLLTSFAKPIKALSLGCGFGVIERVLRRHDYCQLIHGVDVAEQLKGHEKQPSRRPRRPNVRSRGSKHCQIPRADL